MLSRCGRNRRHIRRPVRTEDRQSINAGLDGRDRVAMDGPARNLYWLSLRKSVLEAGANFSSSERRAEPIRLYAVAASRMLALTSDFYFAASCIPANVAAVFFPLGNRARARLVSTSFGLIVRHCCLLVHCWMISVRGSLQVVAARKMRAPRSPLFQVPRRLWRSLYSPPRCTTLMVV